ncbi:MAG: 3'(2'),5'-bisphosphate nucleotidase CysQ [Kiritimatiellales bacterium]
MTALLTTAAQAALDAGSSIMQIYDRDFSVEYKDDRSPLTEADKAAHHIICAALESFGLPILSEESKAVPYAQRKGWTKYWLVDPLDGTKEFIKKNGEFTVNIALIENGRPVLGVVYAPVLQTIYYGLQAGSQGHGAWRSDNCTGKSVDEVLASAVPCPVLHAPRTAPLRVVASRSHCNEETKKFIEELEVKYGAVELVSSGSSLKLCMVAEGLADVYPRIAPTMEWDTAAAQAVVEASGGTVMQYGTNEPLHYNKENLRNPFFIVKR